MRIALVGFALLGLLALAAMGSSGDEWGGGLEERTVPRAFVDYAYTAALIGLVVWAAVVVWAFATHSRGGLPERPRGFSLVSFLFFMLALTFYFTYTNADLTRREVEDEGETRGVPNPEEPPSVEGLEGAPGPEFQWWVPVVLALAVAAFVLYQRSRQPERAEQTPAEELEAVLSETLDELEFDLDPRRAVIQAYARMEKVLAAHGHARRPHEAPLEYLARVLRALDVRAEAAHALTELFERAKFSRHEIDVAMKDEAVASLAAVRDDLRLAA